MINVKGLSYSYNRHSEEKYPVLDGITIYIETGSFTALMGSNGSGKSTLALCIKGIIKPDAGSVFVDGYDINDENTPQHIENSVGIIFQNPDNQFISTSVEREIAFGLENTGTAPAEMENIVNRQIDRFSLGNYRKYSPERLSGGEKQKVLLASVMASDPKYLILDEATSYLDPYERNRILGLLHDEFKLKKEYGFSVILITQRPYEALDAERLIVMDGGRIVFDDTPDKIFRNVSRLKEMGIRVPLEYELME